LPHQRGDRALVGSVCARECNAQLTVSEVLGENSTLAGISAAVAFDHDAVQGSHTTPVGYLVATLKTRYRTPAFDGGHSACTHTRCPVSSR